MGLSGFTFDRGFVALLLAVNLLRAGKEKRSLKLRRQRVGWNTEYFAPPLGALPYGQAFEVPSKRIAKAWPPSIVRRLQSSERR